MNCLNNFVLHYYNFVNQLFLIMEQSSGNNLYHTAIFYYYILIVSLEEFIERWSQILILNYNLN